LGKTESAATEGRGTWQSKETFMIPREERDERYTRGGKGGALYSMMIFGQKDHPQKPKKRGKKERHRAQD